MTHKLSVTVQIDLDGKNVRIMATGCLTEANQQALPPLIARARTLTPGIRVTVDLSGAEHVEAAGADLLRWAIDHDGPQHGPVELVLPEPAPGHPAAEPGIPPAPADSTAPGRRPRAAV